MDIILQFFQDEHCQVQKIESAPVIRCGYRGEHGTWVCYARVDEENRRFVFHALMGLNIPPQYRPAVLDYLNRVNCQMQLGSFEMDLDSGDVRCKTALEIPDGALTTGMVRALVTANLQSMDRYFPGLLAVVHGGLTPEAALARVDAQPAEV